MSLAFESVELPNLSDAMALNLKREVDEDSADYPAERPKRSSADLSRCRL